MQTPLLLYLASVLGAVAVYLLMPQPGQRWRVLGGLLGAATLGLLWLVLAGRMILTETFGDDLGAAAFYYIFSFIAIASAVRVITHTRPVYSALWFVMVIIASAGLLLTLAAEFMAFAMLIIYGGAILVTYMFVIMLASPAQSSSDPSDLGPSYDRTSREPLWAVMAGFLLLAVLLSVVFTPIQPNPDAVALSDAEVTRLFLGDRNLGENADLATPTGGAIDSVTNTEHVGLDLFMAHPLAIELAGIILLVALIGAIAIARVQVRPDAELPAAENVPPKSPASPNDLAPRA
jgi:NADH-quinone oxidoreductase subunit J